MTAFRPRSEIEKDIRLAEDELAIAEYDVDRAKALLKELDEELENHPGDDACPREIELWYAQRDKRQLGLFK